MPLYTPFKIPDGHEEQRNIQIYTPLDPVRRAGGLGCLGVLW